MRSSFKILLMILSLIPLYFAVTGIWGGAATNNEGVEVSAALDNQYRYLSGYYISLFLGIWYVLGDIENRGTVLRLFVLALFIGGLARLLSYTQIGQPPLLATVGMALELGSPILVIWHRMLEKSPGPVVP